MEIYALMEAMGADGPGYIYGMVHPAFPGYIKIGLTTNPKKRLNQYNTGCPQRAYQYAFTVHVQRRIAAEAEAHRRLRGVQVPETEWFRISAPDALRIILSEEEDFHAARIDRNGSGNVVTLPSREVRDRVAD